MYTDFEHTISKIEEIDLIDNNATFILETKNIFYIGKTFLIFYCNKNYNLNNLINLFDEIKISYNENISRIPSEFLVELLKNYNLEDFINNNNKILFPLFLFFFNDPLFILNQNIIIKINNIKNCNKIEFLYDILKPTTDIDEILQNLTVPIKIYSLLKFELKNCISLEHKNLQELFWIYKNNNSELFIPVNEIFIKENYYANNNLILLGDNYFCNNYEYKTLCKTMISEYMYTYKLQSKKNKLNNSLIDQKNNFIIINQNINKSNKISLDECFQLILTKSVYVIEKSSLNDFISDEFNICPICFEKKINIEQLDHEESIGDISLHKMCNQCFYKLKKNVCPFCNGKIIPKSIYTNSNDVLPDDIEWLVKLVMDQTDCERYTALSALQNNDYDIVNAIMDLTL